MEEEVEYFDVIDFRNNIVGKSSRNVVHWLGLRHRISAVILQRADGKTMHTTASKYSLETGKLFHSAAGHVSAGETYEECAKRELLEECGVKVDKVKLLGGFWFEGEREGKIDKERFQVYMAKYDESMGPIKLNHEQLDARWLSREELKEIFHKNYDSMGGPFKLTCTKILKIPKPPPKISESRKLQYIFKQKEVERLIKIGNRRETDAEHIFGCLILAEYFLSKESLKHINKQRVFEILLFHDLVENESGDVSTFKKTPEHVEKEKQAVNIIKKKIPTSLIPSFSSAVEEYENQSTIEARFCKAMDKLEPNIQLLDEIDFLRENGITKKMAEDNKDKYIKQFPEVYEVYKESMDIIFD